MIKGIQLVLRVLNPRSIVTLLFSIGLFMAIGASAQERCATTVLQKLQNRTKEADARLEEWIRLKQRVVKQETQDNKRRQATYQIPVVVHIIHNGTGHATDIPDAQVLSQIRVLNEDFNRENLDASQTPAEFASVAGALGIEFVLAKRTPEGLPTNGIVRVQGPKTTWKVSDNYSLKSLSYWPAEDYLNIWVCNLEGYLGYAQFPRTTLLDGLENSSTNRLTDGVVIAYDAFGSVDDGNFALDPKYNRGRTTTHEVGHFLGLKHISGDDDGACGNDGDYVADTPDQASQTYNCPSHPQVSCTVRSMFQNYLDYTNDACMNLFTQGQVERMVIILDNSPRRKSLTESLGATDPEPFANDLGVKSIVSPAAGACPGTVSPVVRVRNYGSNLITSADIRFTLEGGSSETVSVPLNLLPEEEADLPFSDIALSEGSAVVEAEVLTANGGADGYAGNNIYSRTVITPTTISTPVNENFNAVPESWLLDNPDGLFAWEIANTPLGTTPNSSLMLNFFDYEDSEGEIDMMVTPIIDLVDAPVALMLFDVAHARYRSSNDGMRVVLLANCNPDINQGVVLYDKSGAALATTGDSNSAFIPTSASQWRTEGIDLTDYIGQRIQLAFVGVNDYGNNLYLDNFRLLTNAFINLSLVEVIAPSPATCASEVSPRLLVRNSGTTITNFNVSYQVNGVSHQAVIETNLEAGAEAEITLPAIELQSGANELSFTLEGPDGTPDVDLTDNTQTRYTAYNDETTRIPFREDFEEAFGQWTSISPNNGMTWEATNAGGQKAVYHQGFNNTLSGSEAWLVSPSFDLSEQEVANLYFDLSYALRGTISDVLQVRASTGCDSPFDIVLATYADDQLSEVSRNTPWMPATTDDWQTRRINLSALLGEDNVRLAFVVTNKKGNNLYLDNTELYLSDILGRVDVEGVFSVYPNPIVLSDNPTIAFNFSELQRATVEVVDNTGRIVFSKAFDNVLNQIIELPATGWPNGLYHVRVGTAGEANSAKLLISR